jgi:hypothetical protein
MYLHESLMKRTYSVTSEYLSIVWILHMLLDLRIKIIQVNLTLVNNGITAIFIIMRVQFNQGLVEVTIAPNCSI